jgi:hypothetical protein
MKALSLILVIVAWLIPALASAEGKEIPFTPDDRDRIIRTEQKIEALDSKIDTKVDDLRERSAETDAECAARLCSEPATAQGNPEERRVDVKRCYPFFFILTIKK